MIPDEIKIGAVIIVWGAVAYYGLKLKKLRALEKDVKSKLEKLEK